jgi:hypothetical protein
MTADDQNKQTFVFYHAVARAVKPGQRSPHFVGPPSGGMQSLA